MIILDTNVVSEPLRRRPASAVVAWLDGQAAETLCITTTSLAELLGGAEVFPPGKRKRAMASAMGSLLDHLFANRILSFDRSAAVSYASLFARTRNKGFSISVSDAQIAAIAEVHGYTVATRDTAPFSAAGVPFLNPWKL
jgi:predicted nucleic acid-binding protein